jgi:hypothetical protein
LLITLCSRANPVMGARGAGSVKDVGCCGVSFLENKKSNKNFC